MSVELRGPARSAQEVVHDLAAPLAVIRSQCELLERMLASEPAAELRHIRSAADAMAQRISDALVDEPEAAYAPEPVDAAERMRSVAERLAPLARMRGVGVQVSTEPRAIVLGRGSQLESALQNLLDNAMRHTPRGTTVTCTVRTRRGRVQIHVNDEGSGIPERERGRMLRWGEHGAGDGSGIGLAIVARVAAAHGGTIELLDRPGGGTRAALELPAARLGSPRLRVQRAR